jgi:hypothetical protein
MKINNNQIIYQIYIKKSIFKILKNIKKNMGYIINLLHII